VLKE
jgi:hypothetical protein